MSNDISYFQTYQLHLVGVCPRKTLGRGVRDHGGVVDADGVGRLQHLGGRVVPRESDSVFVRPPLQVGDGLEGVGRRGGQALLPPTWRSNSRCRRR